MQTWLQFFGRLHPVLLHVPIGALALLACCELFGLARREPTLSPAARRFAILLIAAAALVTAGAGWLLGEEYGHTSSTFERHRLFGIGLATCTAAAALAAGLGKLRAYGWLLALALVLVAPTGHFGATLTHGEGYLTEPFRAPEEPVERVRTDPTPTDPSTEPAAAESGLADGATTGSEGEGPAFAGGVESTADASGSEGSAGSAGSAGSSGPTDSDPAADVAGWYEASIAPILGERCARCHGPGRKKAGLAVHDREGLLAGGFGGPVLVPGDPDASELVRRLRLPVEDDEHMPPSSKPQPTAQEIAELVRWIAAGAPFEAPDTGASAAPASSPAEHTPSNGAARPQSSPSGTARVESAPRATTPDPAAFADLLANQVHAETIAPDEHLLWLDFGARSETDDAFALEHLWPLRDFVAELSLADTAITDALLPTLAELPRLERLDLTGTGCTAGGLAVLGGHPSLAVLNLTGVAVGDEVLATLAAMPELERAFLWNTRVTPAAASEFAAEHPRLRIESGAGVGPGESGESGDSGGPVAPVETEPPVVFGPDPKWRPVNTKCPVTGKPLDPEVRIVAFDQVIGFCCAACPSAFWAEPDKYLLRD